MIELSLLGLHALRGPDGRELTSLPAQPKRFALLACLAIGRGGYHRRDTLAAMFWPDMDQFAARRALRNTLYHLRESLGDNVIVTRGDDAVSINPDMLTSDVTRLHDAVDAGRHEEALDLYRGELLAGIHFANAGDAFEAWLTAERQQVAELVMRATRALIERDERAGNAAGAAYWAQRACALAPGDETCLRRAMTLLDTASDSGSALRLFDAFARRLATEFNAKPSQETRDLATRIRAGGRSAAPVVVVPPPPSQAARQPVAPVTAAPAPAAGEEIAAPVIPVASAAAPRRRRGRGMIFVGLGALAALAVTITLLRLTRTPPTAVRPRVLIAVFDNRTGDTALQALGRMTQDWLAQGIIRTQLVDVVDARAVYVQSHQVDGATLDPATLARRTGASLVVSGSYYRTRDTLFFQASVLDVHAGQIVRAIGPVVASTATPVAALDELRSRVMTALTSLVDVRATQGLGTEEVPPFDAYQSYVEGWDAFWHGAGRRAESLFVRAARRDTAFVVAAVAAASTAGNTGDCALIDSVSRVLYARARPIDRIDRLSLQIAVDHCHGRNEEMLRLALERADLEPQTSGHQISAAAAALWADRPARALQILKRIDPAVDLAWSTDTTHFDYWSDLTEAYHLLGRHDDELAAAGRVPSSAPLSRAWMRGRALAALSRPTAVLALIDSALALPVEMTNVGLAPGTDGRPQYIMTPGWVTIWIARELAVHGDTVAARQAAGRAVAWYRSRSLDERSTFEERLVAMWSFEMLGDDTGALRMAEQLRDEDSTNVDVQGELASLAARRGDTATAAALDRWLAAQPVARVSWSASVYRAQVAARLGHLDDAVTRTREARDEGAWPLWIHLDPALIKLQGRPDYIALTAPRG